LKHPKGLTAERRGSRRFILYYPLLHKTKGEVRPFTYLAILPASKFLPESV